MNCNNIVSPVIPGINEAIHGSEIELVPNKFEDYVADQIDKLEYNCYKKHYNDKWNKDLWNGISLTGDIYTLVEIPIKNEKLSGNNTLVPKCNACQLKNKIIPVDVSGNIHQNGSCNGNYNGNYNGNHVKPESENILKKPIISPFTDTGPNTSDTQIILAPQPSTSSVFTSTFLNTLSIVIVIMIIFIILWLILKPKM
ncbi:hypothetical protein Catovirus_2_61 [Catovirus CTV1]|uniref:Uncharacterized protein n=1 Tax=Catovirus CTV1 TaxID=1977631 RepID=A0A1V0SBN1_9VIRU|nr:hypothetical protein Catovirus_2_61 [Catovirus CTV1]